MNRYMKSLIVLFGFIFVAVGFSNPYDHLPQYQPDAQSDREAIPAIYQWNLKDLCASDDVWNQEIEQCKNDLEMILDLHADLQTPSGLLQYLDVYFKLDDTINRLTVYASLQRDSESSNPLVIDRHNQALALTEAVMQEGGILRETILNLSTDDLKKAISEKPELKKYTPYFKSLTRRAKRLLSPAEEKLMGMAGDNMWAQIDLNELPSAPEKAFRSMISDLVLPKITGPDQKDVQMTFSNYPRLRGSDDRTVRRDAVAGLFNTLKTYENTFATLLGEQARFSYFLAKSRGYESVLEAYLDRDNLKPAVYLNLVNTVRDQVKPLHKYVALRKKSLNLETIHLYDLYIPMVKQASVVMDYKAGADVIIKAMAPLGKDYVSTLKQGLDPANGWIDVYPSNDKNSGAFSVSTYGVHPYVKMNFQNSFNDVSTLAHEYGHALHSYYAMNHQSYLSWRYSPFLAEIASTCNEALLSQYMIDHVTSKEERIWLLSELLETIRTTIYRQTMFAEFELKLHQLVEAGESVNAEKLNKIYIELLETYYGPDYTIDENDGLEWAYIPHFYYKYYVFTYATGLASGIAFAEKITTEGDGARDAYLGMLKGGSSEAPLDMLRKAGVELTEPKAIQSALDLFDRTVDELEKLIIK